MKRVTIAYDPDLCKIGTTVVVTDDEARVLIREGTAALAAEEDPQPAEAPAPQVEAEEPEPARAVPAQPGTG